MLTLGTVAFSVTEAAYQALRRSTRFRVPAQQRVGAQLAYQYTGPGEDRITLSGVIMPTYRGRPSVLDDLRALAAEGESRLVTSGTGEQLGRWIIDDVSQEHSGLFSDGRARRIAYTVKLLRDEDERSGQLTQLENAAAATGDVRAVTDAVGTAVAAGQDSPGVIAAARGAA